MIEILRKLFRNKKTPAAQNVGRRPPQGDSACTLPDLIRWVAEQIDDSLEYKRRAKLIAVEVGPAAIGDLGGLLHSEHSPPKELEEKFPGLGQWIAARQFAIFEILYHIGEPTLPLLREVAFGAYDWTQGNAIEILCRLAADGIDRERTVRDLAVGIPTMREEAVLYAAGPLRAQAASSSTLQDLVDELLLIPEFKTAWDEVTSACA